MESYVAYLTIKHCGGNGVSLPRDSNTQQQFTYPIDTDMNVEIVTNKKALATVRTRKRS